MATLTGIITTAEGVGSIVPGISAAWGANPTVNGKEYLITGTLKSYESKYSNFAISLPGGCFANITNSNASWTTASTTGGGKTFFVNNNYIHCLGSSSEVRRGNTFSSAPTSENPTAAITPQTGVIRDFFVFNNLLCFAFGSSSYNGNRGHIVTTSGNGTYTERSSPTVSETTNGWYLGYVVGAASNTLAVAMNAYFHPSDQTSTAIITSTNGTSWTTRTPSVTGLYPARLAWVPVANAFLMVANTGAIYTTTDGYTLTSRTAPSGMPTDISLSIVGNQGLQASSPTSTLISLGGGKVLKITGLTNYTILDYTPYFSNSVIYGIVYDGTKFIFATSTQNIYTSTDEGVTLTRAFSLYNANVANSSQTMAALSYANSRLIGTWNYRTHDITPTSNTPDLIGVGTISYFDPSVLRMPAYIRLT